MKKILATILALVLALGLCSVSWADDYAAEVEGGQKYATLREAVAAVPNGGTVTLLKNSSGGGIATYNSAKNGDGTAKKDKEGNDLIEAKSFTIDFNTFTYTVTNPAVGSKGYESQAFHLEWAGAGKTNHKVLFKNGAIKCAAGTDNVQVLIMNYCDLELLNMNLDGTELVGIAYVASFCNGNSKITGNTTLTAKDSGCAFDVWAKGNPYPSVGVEVDTTGTIDGKVETGANKNATEEQKQASSFVIKNGHFEKAIANNNDKGRIDITSGVFANDITAYADGAGVVLFKDTYYVNDSIGEALSAVKSGDTLDVVQGHVDMADVPVGVIVKNSGGDKVTVNGNEVEKDKTYTVPTKSTGGYYYYQPATDTKANEAKGSPKTFDAGVGIYAVTAVLSVTGMAWTAKKRH